MSDEEFYNITLALQTYYPKENMFPNEQAIELWFRQLNDIDYKVMSTALDMWVNTNKWSPTISDLREYCLKIKYGDLPDWGEAYEKVLKAVGNFGRTREKEALESLDELTRKVVKMIGFQNICMSNIDNRVNDRASFRDLFNNVAMKEREEMKKSENLKTRIAETRQAQLTENIVNQLEAKDV